MAVGSEAGCSALKQQVRGIAMPRTIVLSASCARRQTTAKLFNPERISCAVPCRPLAGDPSRQQVLQLLSLKQCDRLRVVGVV